MRLRMGWRWTKVDHSLPSSFVVEGWSGSAAVTCAVVPRTSSAPASAASQRRGGASVCIGRKCVTGTLTRRQLTARKVLSRRRWLVAEPGQAAQGEGEVGAETGLVARVQL